MQRSHIVLIDKNSSVASFVYIFLKCIFSLVKWSNVIQVQDSKK